MKNNIKVLLFALATIALYSCSSSSANTPVEKKEKKQVTSTVNTDVKTWTYDTSVNDMGDKIIQISVKANDLVDFEFPYNGGSLGDLTIRKKNEQTSVIFYIDKGQIDTDYDGTYIRVKFDDNTPVKWLVSESSSGSTNIVFLENEKSFITKLKSSKKVVMEIPFYQSGNRQFVFNTSNLSL